jgi:hypothetical protein
MPYLRLRSGVLLVGLVGCAGVLEDPDRFRSRASATAPTADGGASSCADPSVAEALFASESCAAAGCHAPPTPAQSLDLKSPGLASRVVGVAARSGGLLADPASAATSALYRTLLPDARSRMPLGGPSVDDATTACVLGWIALQAAPSSPIVAPPSVDAGPVLTAVRVAAGATAPYTDPEGNVWSADTGFQGGETNNFAPAPAITGTTTAPLYTSERYARSQAGSVPRFAYAFALAAGRYTVTLKFAENYFDTAGQRVFDVAINAKPVLTDFDIVAIAGKNAAVDRPFPVELPAAGTIEIVFTSTPTRGPKVSAISIVSTP